MIDVNWSPFTPFYRGVIQMFCILVSCGCCFYACPVECRYPSMSCELIPSHQGLDRFSSLLTYFRLSLNLFSGAQFICKHCFWPQRFTKWEEEQTCTVTTTVSRKSWERHGKIGLLQKKIWQKFSSGRSCTRDDILAGT